METWEPVNPPGVSIINNESKTSCLNLVTGEKGEGKGELPAMDR